MIDNAIRTNILEKGHGKPAQKLKSWKDSIYSFKFCLLIAPPLFFGGDWIVPVHFVKQMSSDLYI